MMNQQYQHALTWKEPRLHLQELGQAQQGRRKNQWGKRRFPGELRKK